MKKIFLLLLLMLVLFLFGCADSSTKGNLTERNYEDLVVVKDTAGPVTLNVYLSGSSETDSDLKQDTKNSSSIDPKTSAGWNGGTAALADEATSILTQGAIDNSSTVNSL